MSVGQCQMADFCAAPIQRFAWLARPIVAMEREAIIQATIVRLTPSFGSISDKVSMIMDLRSSSALQAAACKGHIDTWHILKQLQLEWQVQTQCMTQSQGLHMLG